jgi:hypothetical protein
MHKKFDAIKHPLWLWCTFSSWFVAKANSSSVPAFTGPWIFVGNPHVNANQRTACFQVHWVMHVAGTGDRTKTPVSCSQWKLVSTWKDPSEDLESAPKSLAPVGLLSPGSTQFDATELSWDGVNVWCNSNEDGDCRVCPWQVPVGATISAAFVCHFDDSISSPTAHGKYVLEHREVVTHDIAPLAWFERTDRVVLCGGVQAWVHTHNVAVSTHNTEGQGDSNQQILVTTVTVLSTNNPLGGGTGLLWAWNDYDRRLVALGQEQMDQNYTKNIHSSKLEVARWPASENGTVFVLQPLADKVSCASTVLTVPALTRPKSVSERYLEVASGVGVSGALSMARSGWCNAQGLGHTVPVLLAGEACPRTPSGTTGLGGGKKIDVPRHPSWVLRDSDACVDTVLSSENTLIVSIVWGVWWIISNACHLYVVDNPVQLHMFGAVTLGISLTIGKMMSPTLCLQTVVLADAVSLVFLGGVISWMLCLKSKTFTLPLRTIPQICRVLFVRNACFYCFLGLLYGC